SRDGGRSAMCWGWTEGTGQKGRAGRLAPDGPAQAPYQLCRHHASMPAFAPSPVTLLAIAVLLLVIASAFGIAGAAQRRARRGAAQRARDLERLFIEFHENRAS